MQTQTQTKPSLIQRYMHTIIVVFVLFVLVNIGLIVWVFSAQKTTTNPLWAYVSDDIQQAILVHSDTLLGLLGTSVGTVSNNPLYSTLQRSNHIGLLQFGAGLVNESSAILVDAKKNFSIEDFLASINMQDATDYTVHKYTDNIYIFAQPGTINRLLDESHRMLASSERYAAISPLIANKAVGLVSRVNPDATDDQAISDFVAQTDVFVLGIQAKKSRIHLDAHLLYTTPKTTSVVKNFAPQMTRYIDAQTVAYIETSLDGLWADDEKDQAIQALRAYDPLLFTGISDDDVADIISDNTAVLLQNSPTFSDLRLALLMDNPSTHALLRGIFPLLQEPLAALAGIDPSMIQSIQENDRIAYQATLFGLVPLMLQTYLDGDTSVVSLGASSMLTAGNTHRVDSAPAHSMGYMFVQFDPLLQLYKQLSSMAGGNVQDPFYVQQEKLLQGKTRGGYITADADKISLQSTIE